jgi:hypothetical protein
MANASEIRAWWGRWPDANIGIVTGRASGLVVLDIDPRNGGDDGLAQLVSEHGSLPSTATSRTGGGGEHLFFATLDRVRSCVPARGVDLQGEGKLVAVPPSLHQSGRRYCWARDVEPAVAPPWVLGLPIRQERKPRPREPLGAQTHAQVIREGHRNVELTRYAGRLRLVGLPRGAISAALAATNAERCVPPLNAAELDGIVDSSMRWHGAPWLTSPRDFFAGVDSTDQLVLRVMCDYVDGNGWCRISQETLAKRAGIGSTNTVAAAIRRLERAGRISVIREPRKCNRYRVNRGFERSNAIPTAPLLVDRPQDLGLTGRTDEAAA